MVYVQDTRQRQEVIRRAATALVTLTHDLLVSAPVYGDYNPAILMIGPELLRDPALEQYFPPRMLREIYAAMNGREERYCQIGDVTNLLSLQQCRLAPEGHRRVAQELSALGIPVSLFVTSTPETRFVWMADHACESAITRVASIDVAGVQDPRVEQVRRQSVPMVLSTARGIHRLRDDAGQLIDIQPIMLSLDGFLQWFQQRLTLATDIRLTRFPDNPLWMDHDGRSIRGAQDATPQHHREFADLLDMICVPEKRRRGRPRGTTYFTRDEFLAAIRQTAQFVLRNKPPVLKSEVAAHFHLHGGVRTTYRQLQAWLTDFKVDWEGEILSSLRP